MLFGQNMYIEVEQEHLNDRNWKMALEEYIEDQKEQAVSNYIDNEYIDN